ncbi:MAG TPA: hypothetical protein VJL29_11770, partial [Thermoguttaceae bacterium]|nr:hypothetical protein [Thermoguttaceae bacterium]
DADGRYRLVLSGVSSKSHRDATLIVGKEGKGLAWKRFDPDAKQVEASFELADEQPILGRLLDKQGDPAAGIRVSPRAVLLTVKDDEYSRGVVGYPGFETPPRAWPPSVTTDQKGRFVVHGIGPGHGVWLRVGPTDQFAPQDLTINSGMSETRGEHDGTYRAQVKNVKPGQEAVITLAPAQIFEGVVSFEDTGKPAGHARLTIWSSQQKSLGSMYSLAGKADAEGRYRIAAYPGNRFGVTAYPPNGEPYLTRKVEDIVWEDDARTKNIYVALPRGVMVWGRVVDSTSGEPIAGATVQYLAEGRNNPHKTDSILTGWQGIQLSGDDGRFEIVVLPGPGRLLAHGPDNEYVLREFDSGLIYNGRPGGRRYYASAIEKINPKPGSEPIETTLRLVYGEKVSGRVVDENNKPADGAIYITRLKVSPSSPDWGASPIEALGGRFTLSNLAKDQEYPVYFLDAKRRLGATALLTAGEQEPTVVLKPCGSARATFVDEKGQALAGLSSHEQPSLHMVVTPGVCPYDFEATRRGEIAADADFVSNIDRTNYWPVTKTDEQGRVTFPALIPDATYCIYAMKGRQWITAKEFTARSGETIDLGKIVVERDKKKAK